METPKRLIYVLLACVLSACDPHFIQVTVTGLTDDVVNLEISSWVDDDPRRSDDSSEDFVHQRAQQRQAGDLTSRYEYHAEIPSSDRWKQYTLTVSALDVDGCAVTSGKITTRLGRENGSVVIPVPLELKRLDQRRCKLQIEKVGELSLDQFLAVTSLLSVNVDRQRQCLTEVPVCSREPKVPLPSQADRDGRPGGEANENRNACRKGCTCPQRCKYDYAENEEALLTLLPLRDYNISWSLCEGTVEPKTNSCRLRMNKKRTVRISVAPQLPLSPGPDEQRPSSGKKLWGDTLN